MRGAHGGGLSRERTPCDNRPRRGSSELAPRFAPRSLVLSLTARRARQVRRAEQGPDWPPGPWGPPATSSPAERRHALCTPILQTERSVPQPPGQSRGLASRSGDLEGPGQESGPDWPRAALHRDPGGLPRPPPGTSSAAPSHPWRAGKDRRRRWRRQQQAPPPRQAASAPLGGRLMLGELPAALDTNPGSGEAGGNRSRPRAASACQGPSACRRLRRRRPRHASARSRPRHPLKELQPEPARPP